MSLVAVRQDSLDLSLQSWNIMKEQASMLVKSGFLPVAIKTPEAAMAIMLKGRELGIPAMQAFAHISVINGKPAIGAELMLSLIRRTYPSAPIKIKKREDDGAVILAGRPTDKPADYTEFSFTIDNAKRAGLLGKSSWQGYPRNMCFWRAVSDMARSLYPECLMGCSHTPEELGAEVNEDGEIVDVIPARTVAAKPSPEKSEPPQEKKNAGYNGCTEHQQILHAALKKKNVPETDWELIHEQMLGLEITKLDSVIAEIRQV